MKRQNNQTGSALVLTLMLMTLLMLFVLTLFFQVTNTTRQVAIMEEQLDAELIADMGIDFFRSKAEGAAASYNGTGDDLAEYLEKKLEPHEVDLGEERSFAISNIQLNLTSGGPMTITFESTGSALERDVTEESEIILTEGGEGQ
ncbi:hypothetical protein [Lentibacillus sediminis]|uniref:hypothetical protein n=1 Tax=Lentibacillus sediminis TaxID=1940529 RepID=UPI000C1C113B|nr:hypothetical protein [Lentibacillus sediminis]